MLCKKLNEPDSRASLFTCKELLLCTAMMASLNNLDSDDDDSMMLIDEKNRRNRPNQCTYWASQYLLAGEYPAAAAGGASVQATRLKLGRYLDCGVRTFVDLTQEGENDPYDTILQEEARKRECSVRYYRMPIPDFGVPSSQDTMKEILDTIDMSIKSSNEEGNGKAVYVHCRGGIGRTGTVVGCWLVRNTDRTGEEALDETNRLFLTYSERSRESAKSPETREQMECVRTWNEL